MPPRCNFRIGSSKLQKSFSAQERMASYHVLHRCSQNPAFASTLSLATFQPLRCGRRTLAFSCQAHQQQPSETPSVSTRVDEEKEQLAAKLAAAEAETEALKKELAARRSARDVDLAKLKPAIPEKRIDGMGFRETLFSGTGKESDGETKDPNSWGLLEAELFLSKGAPTEGSSLGGPALADNSNEIVKRRLFIGLGITVVAVGLSFLKLPQGFVKPSKPLFFYLGPIVRLREKLKLIEDSSSDVDSVRQRLQQALDPTDVSKDTFLSATGWLEGADADKAISLTFTIFDYLNQADYNKYFEAYGKPSTAQRLEFLRFSLQALQAARENVDLFLSIMPEDALQAARNNLKLVDKPILLQYLDSDLK